MDPSSADFPESIRTTPPESSQSLARGADTMSSARLPLLLDHNVHYPYQKAPYCSPSPFLSYESKRIIRQAQEPMFATAPRVSHFLYEVNPRTNFERFSL